MPISAAVVFNVQPGVGSDTANSGGFKAGASGTDYSKQASPQYSLTGLTSVGAGNIILTAAASSDMVGNTALAISGTNVTAGLYEIISVSAGVSITFSTNNNATSITTGAAVSAVIHIGGCMASTVPLITRNGGGTNNGGCPGLGNTINISTAGGSMVLTATQLDFDVKSFKLVGYNAAVGDGGLATITTATNSIFLFEAGNAGFQWQFYNIKFTSTASTKAAAVEDGNSIYYLLFSNCVFDGPKYALETTQTSHHVVFFNCEIKNCTTHAMKIQNVSTRIDSCYIHDNTGDGVNSNGTANSGISGEITVVNSIIKSNTGNGITTTDVDGNANLNLFIASSAIINNSGDGIKAGGGNFSQCIGLQSTLINNNAGWGVNAGSLTSLLLFVYGGGNGFRSNTSGDRNNFTTLPGDFVTTAEEFTNRSGADFSLNSTTGGGAACKGAGFPGVLQIGGTGHADAGPLQSLGGAGTTNVGVGVADLIWFAD